MPGSPTQPEARPASASGSEGQTPGTLHEFEAADVAGRTKDTYLGATTPASGAAVAVEHSILVIAWHLLSTGQTYTDLGGDYFDWRRTSNLLPEAAPVAGLEAMRHRVTLEPAA